MVFCIEFIIEQELCFENVQIRSCSVKADGTLHALHTQGLFGADLY